MNAEALSRPIAGDLPCGASLEDTQLLASFDAFRIFGQSTPLSGDVDWRAIKEQSLAALAQSKDFRLLANLAAASLRLEGAQSFIDLLDVAAGWLRDYWPAVYPLVDDDAILRRNALNGLADNMAVIDALRRVPLVANRQLGSFGLRHIEIASGRLAAAEGEQPATEDQVRAAFSAAPAADLQQLDNDLSRGQKALAQIGERMSDQGGGSQASPDLSALAATLAKMRQAVKPFLPVEAVAGAAAGAEAGGGGGGGGGVLAVGAIRSREDAVRALDAVASFFRTNEPSSPIPLFLDRAKRLVARNFLEVLADLAPDALTEAKRVGGVKDEE